MKPLFKQNEREREKSMTLLFREEKLAEICAEVRTKNPGLSEAKIKQLAIRKYIWRQEGGLF